MLPFNATQLKSTPAYGMSIMCILGKGEREGGHMKRE